MRISTFIRGGVYYALAILIAMCIFFVDINAPQTIIISAGYCLVIFYCWLLPGDLSAPFMASFCSLLVLLGFTYHRGLNDIEHIEGVNRVIIIVIIWLTTVLVVIAKKSVSIAEKAKDDLQDQVTEKTYALQVKVDELDRLANVLSEVEQFAIFLLATDGRVINWNKGAKNIYELDDLTVDTRNFSWFYSKDDQLNNVPEDLLNKARTDGKVQFKSWQRKSNQKLFWANIVITSLKDRVGGKYTFIVIVSDLTDQMKESRIKELEIKNKELEQFSYVASHDLQEPLRTIIDFSTLLHEKYYSKFDDVGKQSIQYISESSVRMRELVLALLEYSTIGREHHVEQVNCNKIISQVLEDLMIVIKDSKANVIVEELPLLSGYKVELRSLFLNLISNAIKFRRREKKVVVKITVREERDFWVFAVSDNGIGIDVKHREKIFTIFHRLHSTDEYEGTGIGLAHCKKIVDLHNGEIWIENNIKHGSIFYFSISKTLI